MHLLFKTKNSETILRFANINIEKLTFHCSKYQIDKEKVKTDKIVVSNEFCGSEKSCKYFLDWDVVKNYTIMSSYVKTFDGNNCLSFLINDKKLLKK